VTTQPGRDPPHRRKKSKLRPKTFYAAELAPGVECGRVDSNWKQMLAEKKREGSPRLNGRAENLAAACEYEGSHRYFKTYRSSAAIQSDGGILTSWGNLSSVGNSLLFQEREGKNRLSPGSRVAEQFLLQGC